MKLRDLGEGYLMKTSVTRDCVQKTLLQTCLTGILNSGK